MRKKTILMLDVYKCLSNLSLPFTQNYFKQKNNLYNLKNTQVQLQNKDLWVKYDTI